MARYCLLAFPTDDSSLTLLETLEDTDFGNAMNDFLSSKSQHMRLQPPLPKDPPKPLPFIFKGHLICHFIGYYYDGAATGFTVPAPLVPPGHIAVHMRDDSLNAIRNTRMKTIAAALQEFLHTADPVEAGHAALFCIVDRMNEEGLEESEEKDNLYIPVFYNDTPAPVPLHILKSTPFRPGDEDQIEYCGGLPFNFPPGFQATHRASQLTAAPAPNAPSAAHPQPDNL